MSEFAVYTVCTFCGALHREIDSEAHREYHRMQIAPLALAMAIGAWLEATK